MGPDIENLSEASPTSVFFDCQNGDGYGKNRLVRSTVSSRLCDIGCDEGKM